MVRDMDNLAAHGVTISENLVRESLQPWEQAVALEQLRQSLNEHDGRGSVRGVAAHLDMSHQTIGPYLRIARAITREVLVMADLGYQMVPGGEPVLDERPMCRLSLAALQRVANQRKPAERARMLRFELAKTDPERRGGSTAATPVATDPVRPDPDAKDKGLQMNIRRPLGSLSAEEARRHLERLAPALSVLVEITRSAAEEHVRVTLPDGRELLVQVQTTTEAADDRP
jgi:hypothetical protein